MQDFDVLVIGSGPGGQKAAIAAAKLDRRVALVERPSMLGGVCLNTGTIPSKTLREAVLYLTGLDRGTLSGRAGADHREIVIVRRRLHAESPCDGLSCGERKCKA